MGNVKQDGTMFMSTAAEISELIGALMDVCVRAAQTGHHTGASLKVISSMDGFGALEDEAKSLIAEIAELNELMGRAIPERLKAVFNKAGIDIEALAKKAAAEKEKAEGAPASVKDEKEQDVLSKIRSNAKFAAGGEGNA